ncbi:sigma-70 family RNA polymerase sigma factor [bacterium]|nr:sigma-70 family RNA polymerase sigma factor [bacterium]
MTRERFDMILRANRDRVYGHALRSLRDADDAEDVTQEAFLRLWRTDPDVPDARIGAWLLRVVHNLCIDHARRRRTVRTYLGQPDPTALADLAAEPHPAAPGAGEATGRIGGELREAMAALTPETRSILLMHYEQGLKLREIAELIDANVSSLKVRIHRARKALRAVLEASDEPPLAARHENGI